MSLTLFWMDFPHFYKFIFGCEERGPLHREAVGGDQHPAHTQLWPRRTVSESLAYRLGLKGSQAVKGQNWSIWLIQSRNSEMRVQTPGWLGSAQPMPHEMTPPSTQRPSRARSTTMGPPLSPADHSGLVGPWSFYLTQID